MLAKLKGLKTYLIAAALAAVAALNGADLDGIGSVISDNAPEAGAVLAAGLVLGRAIKALMNKLEADGVL